MEIERLKAEMSDYADSQDDLKLNPDENVVEGILRGLIKNKERKGEIYCPCRITTGDKKKDKKIVCPCHFHKKEIEQDGRCKCNLFVRKQP